MIGPVAAEQRAPSSEDPDELGAESEPSAALRAYCEAEVDAALQPFRTTMSAEDLAWIRACLLEDVADHHGLHRLARAALPRDVDQSGEVLYKPKVG